MKNDSWIFYDGLMKHPCATFPYAYRKLFNAMRVGVENGRKESSMIGLFKIISPTGKVYSYGAATALAKDQGLVTTDNTLNSKEFKKKYQK
jgi:hypothetical protein